MNYLIFSSKLLLYIIVLLSKLIIYPRGWMSEDCMRNLDGQFHLFFKVRTVLHLFFHLDFDMCTVKRQELKMNLIFVDIVDGHCFAQTFDLKNITASSLERHHLSLRSQWRKLFLSQITLQAPQNNYVLESANFQVHA